MTGEHFFGMLIIRIDDTETALFEQHALALHIFFKRRMLVRTDMIRLEIRENTDVKNKSSNAVHHESL